MQRIHSIWGSIVFLGFFIIVFPTFLILLLNEKWKRKGYLINRIWGYIFFKLTFLPYRINFISRPEKDKPYIYCSNHFSYLDIPLIGLIVNGPAAFVGKTSLAKVPLFGFMYRHFHITVNRNSLKSKYDSLKSSLKYIDNGYSLVIFPEGGIQSKNPPRMASFKDGAFRLAIEKQIPIIPVTIADNWIVLPDDGKFLLHKKKIRVTVHAPVSTVGLSLKDVDGLKHQIFEILDKELIKLNTK